MARQTANPANSVKRGASGGVILGFNKKLNHIPVPFGDCQLFPLLPFPAVCISAIAITPSGFPSFASLLIHWFVLSVCS